MASFTQIAFCLLCIVVAYIRYIYIPFLNSLHLKLQRMEDVQVEVAPGSYAVSAGRYGAPRQHTHIVRLEPGQTVDLGFSL